MPMSDDAPQRQAGQMPVARVEGYRIVYADNFAVRATSADFSITYGTTNVVHVQNPQNPGQAVQLNVIMEQFTATTALPVMKALALHFQKIVEIVEAEIGPIRITAQSAPTDAQMEIIR
jgi:hypothetical protein